MNKIFTLSVLLFVLNCKSTSNSNQMKSIIDEMLIDKGNLYGAGAEGITKQNLIISNANHWKTLIQKLDRVNKVSDGFSQKEIDFEKYNVLAVFDEVKNTGGHSIALEISENTEHTIVNVSFNSPQGMATTVISQPYIIVKIEKSEFQLFLNKKRPTIG
ncbi:MAG: protease complex subunit PrcB family protein [Winogradskyella sp.]|uniref:protease complex subunit PrcB family protein n=1 Tax=Winogradskyella sp. TaxID=1883156 RepID=UPI0025F4B78F|nr:protease complex subunit PrcB family protein [Winogradskyella sp.]NRB59843.1 protease complex subunit PrcB family protein [Winogradskyella sp.]